MKTLSIFIHQNVLKTIGAFCLITSVGLFTNSVTAQNNERTVTGVVSCTDGLLHNAAVVLKGTAIGVATSENGAFTFPQKLKENDVLIVSYLGYKDREIKIMSKTTYIEPFLDDIPLIIVGTLRTEPSATANRSNKK